MTCINSLPLFRCSSFEVHSPLSVFCIFAMHGLDVEKIKRRSYDSRQFPRALSLFVGPGPQAEMADPPTEPKPPSLQTQARSFRSNIGNETVSNECTCSDNQVAY